MNNINEQSLKKAIKDTLDEEKNNPNGIINKPVLKLEKAIKGIALASGGINVGGILKSHKVVTLFENQVFDDVTTNKNSPTIDTEGAKEFALFLFIDSTSSPTDIVFKVQFSNDGGTTWFDLQNDFFGDLRYEDAATAAGVYEVMTGLCISKKIRLRAVATGTSATNKFTVSAYLGLYR